MDDNIETLVYNSIYANYLSEHHLVMMEIASDGSRAVYDHHQNAEEVGFKFLSDAEVNSIVRQICTGWGIDIPDWDDDDGLLFVDAANTLKTTHYVTCV